MIETWPPQPPKIDVRHVPRIGYPAPMTQSWFDRWRNDMEGASAHPSPYENLANSPQDRLELELSTIRIIYSKLKALDPDARTRCWKYVTEVMSGED